MVVKSNSEQVVDNNNEERIGDFLRQQRVAQNKSLEEAAKAVCISEKQLVALENDDYQSLPEAPFLKGHYRAYARYLNADITSFMENFDEKYRQATGHNATHDLVNSPIKEMGRLPSSQRMLFNTWLKRGLILLVVLLIVFVVVKVIGNMTSKNKANKSGQDAQVLELNTNHTNTAVQQNSTKVSGEDQLFLEFKAPTSVAISDATGKVLAQGRQSENLTLSGKAPFDIRIDQAKVVQMKLNNESISLDKYTHRNGSAEFKIAP